jgi:hypothetical protein
MLLLKICNNKEEKKNRLQIQIKILHFMLRMIIMLTKERKRGLRKRRKAREGRIKAFSTPTNQPALKIRMKPIN